MIGESSGVTTLLNNDRIYRDNQVQPESSITEESNEATTQNNSDRTSFSAEALALSQRVVATEGSPEQQQTEQADQSPAPTQGDGPRFLDIRV